MSTAGSDKKRGRAAGDSGRGVSGLLFVAAALIWAGPPAAAYAASGSRSAGPLTAWETAGISALVVASILLAVVATTTLAWMLHAWRTPETLAATRFSGELRPAAHRFSLLVAARHEEAVLGDTLDRLAAQSHPGFEILVIVGDDDTATRSVAVSAAVRHPDLIRVIVDDSVPKSKPAALNAALPHVTGDVVGVFDAEDEVHPALLAHVDSQFQESGADVVQGGVQLMNHDSSWWALRNCLEYFFWYRSRLHFHANARFIPLGGNTVFIKSTWLRLGGGWDETCLAEDCELGVRMSADGARVAVAYDPDLVTREETPTTLGSLIRQRTRWDQGFLQVLGKGEWRRLPTWRQRWLARYTLAMPFLQTFSGLMIPVSAALMIWARVPTLVVLISFLPAVPTAVTLTVELCGLAEFASVYKVRARIRDYVLLVLGTFPYQVLLAFAAIRAVLREVRGRRDWEKTEHVGAHRALSGQA